MVFPTEPLPELILTYCQLWHALQKKIHHYYYSEYQNIFNQLNNLTTKLFGQFHPGNKESIYLSSYGTDQFTNIWHLCLYISGLKQMRHNSIVNALELHLFCINSLRPSDAYICVSKLIIIDSDNGLSPGRHQVIIWINAGILFIGPLGTNFSEILIEIYKLSFKKMLLKSRLENDGHFVSASMF